MERNVLFLCTGNSARSQLGEALLRQRAGQVFRVFSAGTEPKQTVFAPVVQVLGELGLDIADARPKGVREYLGKVHFEKVIIVCGDAEEKCPAIFGPAQRLFWPFADPAALEGSQAEILAGTRRIRDEIDTRIRTWLAEQGIDAKPLPKLD